MKLQHDNLADSIRSAILADIADTLALARKAGVKGCDVTITAVALDEADIPADLPGHQLETPGPHQPLALAARCDWRTLCDSFQIVPDSNQPEHLWVIAGSSSGAMYGVQEILMALTGVIWAAPGDEHTLFGPTYPLPVQPQRPRFAYRGMYRTPPAWAARQRLNFGMASASYFANQSPEERQAIDQATHSRSIFRTRSEHAMEMFLPAEELARHPSWQGLRDGKRCTQAHVVIPDCPQLNAILPVQPCYSNPEVRQAIVTRMAACCNTAPLPSFFGLWPHDGVNNWCQCDECVASTPFEHMHRLGLELREQLPEDHPAAFDLLVYSNMLNLPRNPLPENDRSMAMFCPYLRSFEHGIFDSGGPSVAITGSAWPEPDRINPIDEREYGKLFEQWLPIWQKAKITPALFEYSGHFIDETGRGDHQRYGHIAPPDIREREAIHYAKMGLRIAILCGGTGPWPDHFPDMVWSQSLWGNQSIAQLRSRYYTAVAGEHGDALADALDTVIAALKAHHDVPEAELDALGKVLTLLPDSPRKQAYLDWAQIIRLGKSAFGHRQLGQLEPMRQNEEALRHYVQQHNHRIDSAPRLIHESKIYEQRANDQTTGKRSLEYTL